MNSHVTSLSVTIHEGVFGPAPIIRTNTTATKHFLRWHYDDDLLTTFIFEPHRNRNAVPSFVSPPAKLECSFFCLKYKEREFFNYHHLFIHANLKIWVHTKWFGRHQPLTRFLCNSLLVYCGQGWWSTNLYLCKFILPGWCSNPFNSKWVPKENILYMRELITTQHVWMGCVSLELSNKEKWLKFLRLNSIPGR